MLLAAGSGTIIVAGDGAGRMGQAMTSVVNLNRFRKAKKRADAERRAAENRAAFGRTKAERREAEKERDRASRDLDGKRID